MTQKSPRTPRWRLKKLIDTLTLDQSLDVLFEEYGFDAPTPSAIAQWRKRDSAPGGWTLAIIHIAQAKGVLPDVAELRKPVQ